MLISTFCHEVTLWFFWMKNNGFILFSLIKWVISMLGKIHPLFYVPFKDAPNFIYYIRVCSSNNIQYMFGRLYWPFNLLSTLKVNVVLRSYICMHCLFQTCLIFNFIKPKNSHYLQSPLYFFQKFQICPLMFSIKYFSSVLQNGNAHRR